MPWMVCLPLGIRTIKNIGTSAKENIMAKFFKDPDEMCIRDRLYGPEKVTHVITYSTIKAKQAINDAARVLDYPVYMGPVSYTHLDVYKRQSGIRGSL